MTASNGASRRRPLEGVRPRDRLGAAAPDNREAVLVFALAVTAFLLVAAVTLRQVTEPSSATALLESTVASTTEIDLLLREDLPALRQAAQSGKAEAYSLPGFPVDVYLTRGELQTADDHAIRALVLSRAAGMVYEEGLRAFDRTGHQSVGFFTLQGQMDLVVDRLTAGTHTRAAWGVVLFGVASGVLAAAVLLLAEGMSGFRRVGLATASAGAFGFVVGLLAWFLLGRVGGDDRYVADLAAIGRALFAGAYRNYAIVMLAGLAVAGVTPAESVARRLWPAAGTGDEAPGGEEPGWETDPPGTQ